MNQEDCVVILAGGTGSRLKPYTKVLPKPLIPVGDVPILEIVVNQLRHHGFHRLILAVNYRDGLIRSYFGDGQNFGVDLTYRKEESPLGTIAPLLAMIDELPESFLVMNGDILTDFNFRSCLESHRRSGCRLTLGRYQRRVQVADGVIETDQNGRVDTFREKPSFSFWISMGIYAMNRSVLDYVPIRRAFGMDDLAGAMLADNAPIHTFAHTGSWFDIGCPHDLERAHEAFVRDSQRYTHLGAEPVPVI